MTKYGQTTNSTERSHRIDRGWAPKPKFFYTAIFVPKSVRSKATKFGAFSLVVDVSAIQLLTQRGVVG